MIEDRLSKKQCLRLAALEKAIESYSTRPSIGHADNIVVRAKQFEEYLKGPTERSSS